MGLIPITQFENLVVCPKCRSALNKNSERYYCTNQSCDYSGKLSFPIVDKNPVLVDFEQSILNESDLLKTSGASVIPRNNSWWIERLKKILFPNYVAQEKAILFKNLLKKNTNPPVILIVGGGSMGNGTADLYDDPSFHIISFDIYQTSLTQFIADAHRIPLADRAVDAVWIQNVLEHVLDPWQVVAEIHRVLKQDGLVYAETPFLQHVHEGAYDFTRFTESGHRWLFKNFERIDSGVVVGPGSQLLWTMERIFRDIFRSVTIGKYVRVLLFWLQYLDRFIPQEFAIDDASSVFFLGKKSLTPITPQEIVKYYQGANKKYL